jgi:hypothetical protein
MGKEERDEDPEEEVLVVLPESVDLPFPCPWCYCDQHVCSQSKQKEADNGRGGRVGHVARNGGSVDYHKHDSGALDSP